MDEVADVKDTRTIRNNINHPKNIQFFKYKEPIDEPSVITKQYERFERFHKEGKSAMLYRRDSNKLPQFPRINGMNMHYLQNNPRRNIYKNHRSGNYRLKRLRLSEPQEMNSQDKLINRIALHKKLIPAPQRAPLLADSASSKAELYASSITKTSISDSLSSQSSKLDWREGPSFPKLVLPLTSISSDNIRINKKKDLLSSGHTNLSDSMLEVLKEFVQDMGSIADQNVLADDTKINKQKIGNRKKHELSEDDVKHLRSFPNHSDDSNFFKNPYFTVILSVLVVLTLLLVLVSSVYYVGWKRAMSYRKSNKRGKRKFDLPARPSHLINDKIESIAIDTGDARFQDYSHRFQSETSKTNIPQFNLNTSSAECKKSRDDLKSVLGDLNIDSCSLHSRKTHSRKSNNTNSVGKLNKLHQSLKKKEKNRTISNHSCTGGATEAHSEKEDSSKKSQFKKRDSLFHSQSKAYSLLTYSDDLERTCLSAVDIKDFLWNIKPADESLTSEENIDCIGKLMYPSTSRNKVLSQVPSPREQSMDHLHELIASYEFEEN